MKPPSPLSGGLLRNHVRHRGPEDLTIEPMLDVIVILAFFLIFTAVFSHTSVLEVRLPGPASAADPSPANFELEIIVRSNRLEVAERTTGVLQTIPVTPSGHDVVRLSQYLQQLKRRYPDQSTATLLVANDIDYDTIVQVMDAVSVVQSVEGGKAARTRLFPQIALGDAPI
jgi:biopolymer transport protein ExbD